MVILGVWDGHDSGAAIVRDGRLEAAVNEERLTRRKLEVRFPTRSIRACLDLARVSSNDVDLVAACTVDLAKTLGRWYPQSKETYYQIRRRKTPFSSLGLRTKALKYLVTEWGPNRASRYLSSIALRRDLRKLGLGKAGLRVFDHHHCHGVAAALASHFDTCAVMTIDGVGDGLSATIGLWSGGQLTRIAESSARDSLGIFFEHVTNLLNMRELEDEGKVMALADYAAPVPDEQNPLLGLFEVRQGRIRSRVPGHAMMSYLRSVQWKFANEQFAYMAQRVVEDVCVRLAGDAVTLTGARRLALSGGVASNIKSNRLVRGRAEVDSVFVFPHMGDGGLAVGAAAAAMLSSGGVPEGDWSAIDLGPDFSDQDAGAALNEAGLAAIQPAELIRDVARLIAAGRVVLWFQGRMEYGPRALGYRSILARPDRLDIRDRLNLVLKQRVWYQPFCPSMLESEASRVLSDYAGPPNPHMTMAFMTLPESRPSLAAVISVDGSCRPQIVSDDAPGRFPNLLRAVKAITSLGVVLNTSYNIHGEPLVCTPAEAIQVYQRTEADALVLGQHLVVRP